jgi:signal transduction histidine kinase
VKLLAKGSFWKQSDFFGKASLIIRYAIYLFNTIFLFLFLEAKGIPFNTYHYLGVLIVLLLPSFIFVFYVKHENNKGVGIRQNMVDFIVVGCFIGLIQLSFIPTCLFILGVVCNYIASRGFHKTYRFLLIPLGYALTIPVFGFHLNAAHFPLLVNLSIIYATIHFIAIAYISYQFSKNVQFKNEQVVEQQKEILLQSEEVQALNDSLKLLNSHLEEKVNERTQELSAKNEKLAEYTFINGHHLRAPVATMLGLVQLLDYRNDEEEKEEIIQKLKYEVGLLNITIKEIRLKLETDDLIQNEMREIESILAKQ